MDFNKLEENEKSNKAKLVQIVNDTIMNLKKVSFNKAKKLIKSIPDLCRLDYLSHYNRTLRNQHQKKFHPIRPLRGEIFNAIITENIGSELNGNHLVVIMQNDTGNIFSEKVNVLPIEGNGYKINPKYQSRLENSDLELGKINRDPSRIIISDITTIDKARLDLKVGKINNDKMKEISKKLEKQLNL